ncbi:MAG TPA: DUF2007 domain-containing protein [Pirellulales bacterium]|jgi:hypothetical protein|nr:DUF2007 domain-containing protein [Pirellulales bacterium]
MADPEELVTVYRAADTTEGHLVANLLDEEGIAAKVTDENVPLPGLDIMGPEILVHRRDQAKALEIIAAYEEQIIDRVEHEEEDEEDE